MGKGWKEERERGTTDKILDEGFARARFAKKRKKEREKGGKRKERNWIRRPHPAPCVSTMSPVSAGGKSRQIRLGPPLFFFLPLALQCLDGTEVHRCSETEKKWKEERGNCISLKVN